MSLCGHLIDSVPAQEEHSEEAATARKMIFDENLVTFDEFLRNAPQVASRRPLFLILFSVYSVSHPNP